MAAAGEIYGLFDRTFADGRLESWSAMNVPGPGGCVTLDASNRYLTPRRDVPNAQHVQFTASVDPKGILESMADSDHIHTEENEVYYFTGLVDEAGKRMWVLFVTAMNDVD